MAIEGELEDRKFSGEGPLKEGQPHKFQHVFSSLDEGASIRYMKQAKADK